MAKMIIGIKMRFIDVCSVLSFKMGFLSIMMVS